MRWATPTTRTTWCGVREAGRRLPASTCSACSIRSTGWRTCAWPSTPCCETGKLCEAAICYSGNLSSPKETKYTLDYYLEDGPQAEGGRHAHPRHQGHGGPVPAQRGVHAGQGAQGRAQDYPVHFHTHDTSGIAAASVLAAVAAGCDAVDGAIDAMSGFTSQPNLGSIIEALRYSERDPGIDHAAVRAISMYWEQVRKNYLAFESDMRAGASEVYVHAMPGGQYTNLKEQARGVGTRRFALAGSVAGLCRRQRDVRQHREGHAVVEGGGRHGDHDGVVRTHQGAGGRPRLRSRLPRVRRADDARRPRPARGRLARGHPEEGAEGAEAARAAARRDDGAAGPRRPSARSWTRS